MVYLIERPSGNDCENRESIFKLQVQAVFGISHELKYIMNSEHHQKQNTNSDSDKSGFQKFNHYFSDR